MAMACFSGNTQFAQLLLENGVDINMDLKGVAPWAIASSQGHEELVKFLKDNGVDDSVSDEATSASKDCRMDECD
jgi:ankyrin repeat protein